MFNESDADLARAFAQAREPLSPDAFMANLLLRIDRARRARLWRRVLASAAVLVVMSWNMPLVLEATAPVVRFVGDFSPTYTELLVTPGGWAVSMLVGGWVVLRSRASRR
jgi:hypothetical protein